MTKKLKFKIVPVLFLSLALASLRAGVDARSQTVACAPEQTDISDSTANPAIDLPVEIEFAFFKAHDALAKHEATDASNELAADLESIRRAFKAVGKRRISKVDREAFSQSLHRFHEKAQKSVLQKSTQHYIDRAVSLSLQHCSRLCSLTLVEKFHALPMSAKAGIACGAAGLCVALGWGASTLWPGGSDQGDGSQGKDIAEGNADNGADPAGPNQSNHVAQDGGSGKVTVDSQTGSGEAATTTPSEDTHSVDSANGETGSVDRAADQKAGAGNVLPPPPPPPADSNTRSGRKPPAQQLPACNRPKSFVEEIQDLGDTGHDERQAEIDEQRQEEERKRAAQAEAAQAEADAQRNKQRAEKMRRAEEQRAREREEKNREKAKDGILGHCNERMVDQAQNYYGHERAEGEGADDDAWKSAAAEWGQELKREIAKLKAEAEAKERSQQAEKEARRAQYADRDAHRETMQLFTQQLMERVNEEWRSVCKPADDAQTLLQRYAKTLMRTDVYDALDSVVCLRTNVADRLIMLKNAIEKHNAFDDTAAKVLGLNGGAENEVLQALNDFANDSENEALLRKTHKLICLRLGWILTCQRIDFNQVAIRNRLAQMQRAHESFKTAQFDKETWTTFITTTGRNVFLEQDETQPAEPELTNERLPTSLRNTDFVSIWQETLAEVNTEYIDSLSFKVVQLGPGGEENKSPVVESTPATDTVLPGGRISSQAAGITPSSRDLSIESDERDCEDDGDSDSGVSYSDEDGGYKTPSGRSDDAEGVHEQTSATSSTPAPSTPAGTGSPWQRAFRSVKNFFSGNKGETTAASNAAPVDDQYDDLVQDPDVQGMQAGNRIQAAQERFQAAREAAMQAQRKVDLRRATGDAHIGAIRLEHAAEQLEELADLRKRLADGELLSTEEKERLSNLSEWESRLESPE